MEIITGVVIAIISVLVTIYLQKLKAKQTQKKIKSNYAKKMTKGRGGEGVGETEDILVVNAWVTR